MRLLIAFSLLISAISAALSREDLIEHLKQKQETENTFDSRIQRTVKPIGYVAGVPIWPRVLSRVKSPQDIFLDDDNFAYALPRWDTAGLVRRMDREENFNKIINFLENYE